MSGILRCPGCGAPVEDVKGPIHKYLGASAGCWAVFGRILAKEYGEFRYPEPTHRLTVDTYAVQHPGTPERRSMQSVTGHLVGLLFVLERGLGAPEATRAIGRVLEHAAEFTWLEPPVPNGGLTVLDVAGARDLVEHMRIVDARARDVWAAWAPHHDAVRALAAKYL